MFRKGIANAGLIIIVWLVAISIPVGVYIAQQSQDIRQRAQTYVTCADLGGSCIPTGNYCTLPKSNAYCPSGQKCCLDNAPACNPNVCNTSNTTCGHCEFNGCEGTKTLCRPVCNDPVTSTCNFNCPGCNNPGTCTLNVSPPPQPSGSPQPPGPNPQCNSTCYSTSDCRASEVCNIPSGWTYGNCRNPSCLNETSCTCAPYVCGLLQDNGGFETTNGIDSWYAWNQNGTATWSIVQAPIPSPLPSGGVSSLKATYNASPDTTYGGIFSVYRNGAPGPGQEAVFTGAVYIDTTTLASPGTFNACVQQFYNHPQQWVSEVCTPLDKTKVKQWQTFTLHVPYVASSPAANNMVMAFVPQGSTGQITFFIDTLCLNINSVIASPSPTPSPVVQCTNVKLYTVNGDPTVATNWALIPADQLRNLQPGTTIYATVLGTVTNGIIDKARIRMNSTTWTTNDETVVKKPGSQEFYKIFTLPTGTVNFTFGAEVHEQYSNKWF